jgi:hypothetical protein
MARWRLVGARATRRRAGRGVGGELGVCGSRAPWHGLAAGARPIEQRLGRQWLREPATPIPGLKLAPAYDDTHHTRPPCPPAPEP